MKKKSNPEQFKQFLAVFGQIGTLVSATIVLIELLNGNFNTRYQQTLASLAVLVMVILVWVWRWPRITESNQRRSSTTPPKGNTSATSSFLKPFMDAHKNRYTFSLVRRRIEGILLLCISGFALLFLGQRATSIREEISGSKCSYAITSEAPMLVIAELNNLTNEPTAFVNRLYTEMIEQFGDQISVCLQRQVFTNRTEVEEFGKSLNKKQSATIVIWGDSDRSSFEIHIAPIEWTASALQLVIKADATNSDELVGWARVYIPQTVMSIVQLIEGNNGEAIRKLEVVIKKLEGEPWSGDNQETFAKLYFLLAYLDSESGQTNSAIDAYNQVLAYDEGFDDARLNRGVLYMDIDREKARIDFDTLINQHSNLAVYAYANRAALETDWQLQKDDYLKIIELDPVSPWNYHNLGLSALDAGDYQAALKAYEDSRRFLDEETRASFVEDLRKAAEANSSLTDIVEQIIALLNKPAN